MDPTAPRPKLISVVMPVLDEEEHVRDQLAALASQEYERPWELVVVDNGCTDRTIEFVRWWTGRLPSIEVADASDKRGLNYARNVGAAAAQGDFLVFCDADNVADSRWLEAMAEASSRGHLVGGVHELDALNDKLARTWCPGEAPPGLPNDQGFLPYAPGGNCGVWAAVARDLRWDEDFAFGASDIEFSWRAQLASHRLVVAPDAVMHRRLRNRVRALARQQYRYGTGAAVLYRTFRGAGMPAPGLHEARYWWWWLVRRSPDLWRSRAARGNWVRIAATRCGRLAGSVRYRVFAP